MTYASGTSVSVQKTRIEIETLLQKWKCDRSATMNEPGRAVVYFQRGKWHVQFSMSLPQLADIPTGWKYRRRTDTQRQALLEQQNRERWRGLLLVLKAKFTAIETGVETFEECFLAHLVLPGGETVGQKALPAITAAVESGKGSSLFLGPGAA